jgi:hypothetical protein
MMGLGPDRLHRNLDEAKERMSFLHKQCPMPPTTLSKKLLAVHVKAVLKDDEAIREACQWGWVSKKMEEYLKGEKKWPAGLASRKEA